MSAYDPKRTSARGALGASDVRYQTWLNAKTNNTIITAPKSVSCPALLRKKAARIVLITRLRHGSPSQVARTRIFSKCHWAGKVVIVSVRADRCPLLARRTSRCLRMSAFGGKADIAIAWECPLMTPKRTSPCPLTSFS